MDSQKANSVLKAYRDELRKSGILGWADALCASLPQTEVYLVGGAVRDCLLERADTKDYDFVVRNVETPELEAQLSRFGAVNYVGKTFGVYKLKLTEPSSVEALDIALPRTEHAWGTGKYRDVDTQSDPALPLKEDLGRRDFTINAMAMRVTDPPIPPLLRGGQKGGILVDEFNGLEDLTDKKLRTVGNPDERMREDYSRALRGLRFAVSLGFTIEASTWDAIARSITHLLDLDSQGARIIPAEVIAQEFLKALDVHPLAAFDLFESSGTFSILMPELLAMKGCPQPQEFHTEGDVWTHTRLALAVIESPAFAQEFGNPVLLPAPQPLWNAELALAALLHDIGKPPTLTTPEAHGADRIRFNDHDRVGAEMVASLIERLKLTSPTGIGVDANRVCALIRHHLLFVHGDVDELRPSTIEKYFFRDPLLGEELLKLSYADGAATIAKDGKGTIADYKRMRVRIEALKEKGKHTLPKPLLSGHDIMTMLGIGEGPEVGKILTRIREAQLEGKITTQEEAKHYLVILSN
ncbi:MAG: HD domain-containing protein [Patescibacteria group bacterium]